MHRTKGPLYIADVATFGQNEREDVIDYNRPDPDQPGLWCQWVPSDDGLVIEWDGGEKFYYSAEWMKYIITNLLAESAKPYLAQHMTEDPRLQHFTADHVIEGEIFAQGEEPDDRWVLLVKDNVVMVGATEVIYKDPRAI